MKHREIRNLTFSAVCLALGMVLPFAVAGNVPQFAKMLSPMHIPALLCGFLCGWPYGLAVGFIMPLLRSAWIQMPPMPNALAMAFELATYGALAAVLYRALPRKPVFLYATLVLAMLAGRGVWGIASALIYASSGGAFSFQMFLAGAFINAWPGIILHIVLIPPVVLALRRAKLIDDAPIISAEGAAA